MLKRLVLFIVMAFSVQLAWAEGEEKPADDYVNYIELKPFVTNYGGVGKSRFLKCEVTIQVASEAAHHAVNQHMAHIRNDIVFLLGAQTEDSVGTVEMQQAKLDDASLTPSAQILEVMQADDLKYSEFVMQQAQLHREELLSQPLTDAQLQALNESSQASLEAQRQIEAADEVDFDTYLENYAAS